MGIDIVSYLMGKAAGGGGSGVTVEELSVTENGTYTAPSGKAYSPVTVEVSGDPALPSGYQAVEYISADGNQYAIHRGPAIVSGQFVYAKVHPNVDTEICIIGIAQSQTVNGETTTSSNYFEAYIKGNSFNNTRMSTPVQIDATSDAPGEALFEALYDYFRYFLIGKYRTSAGSAYPFNGDIYRITIANKFTMDSPTHDFIPCKRKADNEPGLYDVVNNEFYPSESGTSFVAGPDVN